LRHARWQRCGAGRDNGKEQFVSSRITDRLLIVQPRVRGSGISVHFESQLARRAPDEEIDAQTARSRSDHRVNREMPGQHRASSMRGTN